MRSLLKIQPLLLAAVLVLMAVPASAQTVGSCEDATSQTFLNENNVRASIFNAGNLFWKGSGFVYTVPKNGNANSVFASGIWLGGMVDGEVRFAGTTYGPFEYWPGPLDANGNPPADCSQYDHIYNVTAEQVAAYDQGTAPATQDMINWPHDLGAPVIDGDGNPNNYNLEGGDRPEVTGAQTLWWVMNDVGNVKGWSQTPPIGIEVQVTAFVFRTADALNDMTFYKYKLIYKGTQPLEEAWFGVFVDADLGDATDDFVGSDTTTGLGYVYNGTDTDSEYGVPPALGYDFFQGPLVPAEGESWEDPDGTVHEDATRLGMEKFVYWLNDDLPYGSPRSGTGDGYRYLRGLWRDGTSMTLGGTGYGGDTPVDYMFPGDPTTQSYWSEENTDGDGGRNQPFDRRFMQSTGPFTMNPGDTQEIVFGIVWAQGSDRFDSITKMKQADVLAQNAFDVDFDLPNPPPAPEVETSSFDQTAILTWHNTPGSLNYLDGYDVVNPFLIGSGFEDTTYTFEGYRIFQYSSELYQDAGRELVATYDVENGVTTIVDDGFDNGVPITEVVVEGSDSGVRKSIAFRGLTNYQTYYYGVQAYAYNEHSAPKVLFGPIQQVAVTPSKIGPRGGGTVAPVDSIDADIAAESVDAVGDGIVTATVVDPTKLTGDTYNVDFFTYSDGEGNSFTTYDIINTTTGEKIIDGQAYAEETGKPVPQGSNVVVANGLSFNVEGPEPGPLTEGGLYAFSEVVAPGGEEPCPGGEGALGCSAGVGDIVEQSYNSTGEYVMYHEGTGSYASIGTYAPNEFEIRFTEEGSYGNYGFQGGNVVEVPFEIWDIGVVAPGAENDPSDDVQMVPVLYTDGGGDCAFDFEEVDDAFGFGFGQTDRIYGYYPSPPNTYADYEAEAASLVESGTDGCYEANGGYPTDTYWFENGLPRALQRQVFIAAVEGLTVDDLQGTVVRFYTLNPNLPGDTYALNTSSLAVEEGNQEVAEVNLDEIGIVPNPYKGYSAYETGPRQDVVRFTNLPDRARVRVYTLAGSLVWDEVLSSANNEWDLKTESGLNIASGLYLIHVEVPEVGETIIKFGVVKKRVQLELL